MVIAIALETCATSTLASCVEIQEPLALIDPVEPQVSYVAHFLQERLGEGSEEICYDLAHVLFQIAAGLNVVSLPMFQQSTTSGPLSLPPPTCVLWEKHGIADLSLLASATSHILLDILDLQERSDRKPERGNCLSRPMFWCLIELQQFPGVAIRGCVEEDGDWLCLSANFVQNTSRTNMETSTRCK